MRRCKRCREKFINITAKQMYCGKSCYYASLKVPVEEVYQRDRGICWLCGMHVPRAEASRDHIRPRSFGGPTKWTNIKLAHRDCNSRRGNKPAKEFKNGFRTSEGLSF